MLRVHTLPGSLAPDTPAAPTRPASCLSACTSGWIRRGAGPSSCIGASGRGHGRTVVRRRSRRPHRTAGGYKLGELIGVWRRRLPAELVESKRASELPGEPHDAYLRRAPQRHGHPVRVRTHIHRGMRSRNPAPCTRGAAQGLHCSRVGSHWAGDLDTLRGGRLGPCRTGRPSATGMVRPGAATTLRLRTLRRRGTEVRPVR
jgi:hypothetical protein